MTDGPGLYEQIGVVVLGVIAVALVVMLVLSLAALVDMLGADIGLWHAPCALVHHQPGCKGWR